MPRSTRRRFIKQTLAAGIGVTAGLRPGAFAANNKIRVACIGVRGRGNHVMKMFADQPDCDVTHICDVRKSMRELRSKEMKDLTGLEPKVVNDYRSLLDDKSIDAFMSGTPDHWHALLTIHGCLANKDVYVEKPASHNILEGKTAVAAARKNNRIVQLGTQRRSAHFMIEAEEYVKSGAIGKVIFGKGWETSRNREVHLAPDSPVPEELDYEIWQGPCPERAHNETIVRGAWRWLFDYGTGDLGNDGIHRLDFCRQLMGLDAMPETISSAGGMLFFEDDQQWPDTLLISYEYPGKVLQYEMRLWSKPKLFGVTEGSAVYGENGWVLVTGRGWKAFDGDGKVVKESAGDRGGPKHVRNFLDAMRSRKRESLAQEIYSGHVVTTMCHAGHIAWRTGKKLRFDAKTETFDDRQANNYLGREHRSGYELPAV